MNISEETRARIISEYRSERAKKAAATMRKRFGKDYFKKQGLTETAVSTLGTIRFDCIPHRELTGPLARPPTKMKLEGVFCHPQRTPRCDPSPM